MHPHKLQQLKKLLEEIGIELAEDELDFAAVSIARFVCAKELRQAELSQKERNENG